MLNIPLHTVDAVPRDVLAIGTDYTPGTLLPTHSHRRAQFLYGMSGLMEVETDDGAWTIPPYSGVWIPASKPHSVRMQGVSTRSLYVEPAAAPRPGPHCEALVVSPLLHQLLLSCADLPALYDEQGRDSALVQLVLHEVASARSLPLFAPIPRDEKLAALCKQFLAQPSIRATPQDWAQALNKSLRRLAPAGLPAGGGVTAFLGRIGDRGGDGAGLRQPQRVFHHVPQGIGAGAFGIGQQRHGIAVKTRRGVRRRQELRVFAAECRPVFLAAHNA
jgi:hypothetical protein